MALIRNTHPFNIAHRGASGNHLENTLGAFRLALRQGANALEMDLHQTRDGKLVIHHDLDLARLAGTRKNIRDLDLRDIKGLTLKTRKRGSVLREKIPTLEEVLRLIKGNTVLFLEIKKGGATYPGIEQRLVRTLRRHGLIRRVVVSSFEISVLKSLRRFSPALQIGLLTRDTDPGKILRTARSLRAGSIHISFRRISRRILEEVHREGLPVYIYTVNSKVRMKRFLKMGADGLFTDYPGRLAGLLKTMKSPARR